MKDLVVLDELRIKINKNDLINKLFIKSKDEQEFSKVLNQVQNIAKPKALFKHFIIKSKSKDYVIIENIKFCSKILTVNLKDIYKVFPYLATVGLEVEKWSEQIDDFLIKYWVEIIKEEILYHTEKELFRKIDSENNLDKAAHMNPGSLEDWPISEQKKLFALLGDRVSSIGITLTESMLMYPIKSISGIRFPTKSNYENCQLCKKLNCPSRRVPYKPNLLEEKYK